LQGQTPEAERRREGDTLNIKCPYTAKTEDWQTKYWCRLAGRGYQELGNTYYEHRGQSRDGRIKITDDTANKTVSITMTDLKTEDSGTYFCAYYSSGYVRLRTISLNSLFWSLFGAGLLNHPTLVTPFLSSSSTFLILSVVLLILLVLALITSVTLGVRYSRLLRRTGTREAEDTGDRPEGTAQPGSPGRRESSQDDSKGPAYINLDVQSHPSPEDPLYCNVEPSQAHKNSQNVEYAVIAFSQSPRNGRE
ncbi:CLM9 protein, partial [Mohoua ochrocephala]|nr:CLM9 protein [Mohoua ochrocephala]